MSFAIPYNNPSDMLSPTKSPLCLCLYAFASLSSPLYANSSSKPSRSGESLETCISKLGIVDLKAFEQDALGKLAQAHPYPSYDPIPSKLRNRVSQEVRASYESSRQSRGFTENPFYSEARILSRFSEISRAFEPPVEAQNRMLILRFIWIMGDPEAPPQLYFEDPFLTKAPVTHAQMLKQVSRNLPQSWLESGFLFHFARGGPMFLHYDEAGNLEKFELPKAKSIWTHFETSLQAFQIKMSSEERAQLSIQLKRHWHSLVHQD